MGTMSNSQRKQTIQKLTSW